MKLPFNIQWYDTQHKIIFVDVQRTCTWEEYRTAMQEINAMVRTVKHPVDLIINANVPLSPIPSGGAAFEFLKTLNEQPNNIGTRYIVSAPSLFYATVHLFLRSLGPRGANVARFVNSVDEAVQAIGEVRGKAASAKSRRGR